MSDQNIFDCTGNITGGHKKDAKFIAESFFDPTNDLYPQKKRVDLHMFDGASVCRKAKHLRLYIICCHVLLEQSIPAMLLHA